MSVVVIQARTNSKRLPAKVLLPIAGVPVVVLAAKRAANTGRNVIVATSNESSDDYLANLLDMEGITCYRGDLNNTLLRFTQALKGFHDETIVFRLTADNVLPDGRLLDEMENEFRHRNIEYLCCNGVNSGLPYGVSVEVTRLKNLRAASVESLSQDDAEHVMPAVIRKFGRQYFDKYIKLQMGQHRCTIDCFDDYLSVLNLFEGVGDPVNESVFNLIVRLKSKRFQPLNDAAVPKLVLGTAQLGMPYGIANAVGRPGANHATDMIKAAIASGVEFIDTARAYGDSEAVIGRALSDGWKDRVRVISKLSPLPDLHLGADTATCNAFVDASFYRSCNELNVQKIDTLLIHRAKQLQLFGGRILDRLLMHKEAGRIKTLGVSVQTPDELAQALEIPSVEHIQMPMNILDHRWEQSIKKIIHTKCSRRVRIHVRSIYLQGLLLSDKKQHWMRANVNDPEKIGAWFAKMVSVCGRASIADLCLAYVNSQTWVDGIVIGMETLEQLKDNINLLTKEPLNEERIHEINETRPTLNESTLDPSKWKIC